MRAIITDIRAGKAAALAEDGTGSPCRREEQSGRTGDSDSGEAPQTVEKAADLGGVRGCPVRHGDHRRVRCV